ncbi:PREDICTED: serine/arginine-rich splicing factor 11-like [Amphimedon queenslandica]|uniref:RRM domain-containing protein n=1 Tax=Amphimedon queenslandica TaxID=400682 RepID=A0AAN0J912_AMPQE|nr:PREDICTED: serine/arginine-rich splicing factor 11-like [Amphimedon queenslandica]|eukprot:XP_019853237.1 PREDICTED: serine/arginine-rich splicing factor 11-like [Amphimedon queenslandica]
MAICTIQVTNICPKATVRQMKELFSYLGDIDELRLFPEDENKPEIPSKVCFVTYKERESVETALHLSNTVFIDRALVVAQSRFEIIPEEPVAMSLAAPAVAVAFIDKSLLIGSGVNSGPLLPTPQTSLLGTPQMVFIEFINSDL